MISVLPTMRLFAATIPVVIVENMRCMVSWYLDKDNGILH